MAQKHYIRISLLSIAAIFMTSANLAASQWQASGSNGPVNVAVDRVAFIRSYMSSPSEPLKKATRDFYRSLPDSRATISQLKIRLFKVSSVSDQTPFWFGHLSSLGKKTSDSLLKYINVFYEDFSDCSSFTEFPSAVAEIIGTAPYESFVTTAQGYANFIVFLSPSEITKKANLDRNIYQRNCIDTNFDVVNQKIFFVDPTPGEGPDSLGYFVVIDRNDHID